MNFIPLNPLDFLTVTHTPFTVGYLFFLLILAHFLADFPLQGDYMAKAKNKYQGIFGVPWWQAMTAHCSIHAGFVMLITGSILLGFVEFILHFVIDYNRCSKKLSFAEDQYLHILCKILILFIWIGMNI